MPAFLLKSSTVSREDSTEIHVDATFNDDFDYFGGSAKYTASGSVDRLYQADCKVKLIAHYTIDWSLW